ncbi:MAG: hypothetical protein V1909_00880 [Candidatus Micrarchaeota archaeon]
MVQFRGERELSHKIEIKKVLLYFGDPQKKDVVTGALETWNKYFPTEVMSPMALLVHKSEEHFVLLADDMMLSLFNKKHFMENNPNATVVLLTSNEQIRQMAPKTATQNFPYVEKADMVFSLEESGVEPSEIARMLVRVVEDKKNLEAGSVAKRFLFLVIDDQPCWFSQFLPSLYKIIGKRADVVIARTFEEAQEIINMHGENIAGVITDLIFPKGDNENNVSGPEIIDLIQEGYPRIAIAVASQAAEQFPIPRVLLIPKGREGSLAALQKFLKDYAGLGDFVFTYGGREIGRARNIFELQKLIQEKEQLPAHILEKYGKKDFFSTWFYMHGYDELGDKVRPTHHSGERMREFLLEQIGDEIAIIKSLPLVFEWTERDDGKRQKRVEVNSLKELYDNLDNLPDKLIGKFASGDGFSTWLMIKGYSELADALRPLSGKEHELKNSLKVEIGKWLSSHPEPSA